MALTPLIVASTLGASLGLVGLGYALLGSKATRRIKAPKRHTSGHHALVNRGLLAGVAAVAVLLVTRWPVAGVLAGLAVVFLPAVFGRTSAALAMDQVEAIAVWTELLRDTLGASAGLGEAIIATAPVAPPAIRETVMRLADRLVSGVNMSAALRVFADEVNDPSCDMVTCALLLAATSRTQKLAELLSALSESIREDVAARLRVEASRASSRSSVRTVVIFSLVFVAALMLLARSYLAPLGTPLGQLVLTLVGGCYAAGIALMLHLVRPTSHGRLLASNEDRQTPVGGLT